MHAWIQGDPVLISCLAVSSTAERPKWGGATLEGSPRMSTLNCRMQIANNCSQTTLLYERPRTEFPRRFIRVRMDSDHLKHAPQVKRKPFRKKATSEMPSFAARDCWVFRQSQTRLPLSVSSADPAQIPTHSLREPFFSTPRHRGRVYYRIMTIRTHHKTLFLLFFMPLH